MNIFIDFNNTSVAVCKKHSHLAYKRGWSFLERRPRETEWLCYFSEEGKE